MRPEVLAAGVHKPTLLPMAHIKKYAEGDTQCTIGPQLLGTFRSKDLVVAVDLELNGKNVLFDTFDVSLSKRAKSCGLQGDFISISVSDDSKQGQQEEEAKLDKKDQKLKELEEVLQQLKEENGRWRAVCQQLKSASSKE